MEWRVCVDCYPAVSHPLTRIRCGGRHVPGFLSDSLLEYIPGPHLAKTGRDSAEWERQIFAKLARSVTDLPMQTYLAILSKREYYGYTLFACKVGIFLQLRREP
jgi:hypothetical protein